MPYRIPLALSAVLIGLSLIATRAPAADPAPAPAPAAAATIAPKHATQNVIYITLDGMRWQEVFGGAQKPLIDPRSGGVRDVPGTLAKYRRDTPTEARHAMMPFLWSVVATKGQVFGDPDAQSVAAISNGLKFSYPGYNEMLAGFADPRIDSNNKNPNPNVTVLEYLNGLPAYKGKVEAYGSWDVLPYIVNRERSGLIVNGDGAPFAEPANERQKLVNEMAADLPPYFPGARLDAGTMQAALDALRTRKPRVLYVMLGETDEWAHSRRYDLYLHAANRGDDFIRRVWEFVASDEQYRGKTTLIVSTDHGRGPNAEDWTNHSKDTPGAERIWIMMMGPDTPATGSRQKLDVTQSQIAATIARSLGEDFNAASPKSAPPLPAFE